MNDSQLKIDLQEEIWLPIKGFEGYYEVSNVGNIRSVDRYVNSRFGRKRFIKSMEMGFITGKYHMVTLTKSQNKSTLLVHRLVAEAFKENPTNLPVVNHIDLNKLNNKESNLEWTSYSGNTKHAFNNGMFPKLHETQFKKGCKALNQILIVNIENGIFYDSISEAAKVYPISASHLVDCVAGRKKNKTPFRYA